MRSYPWENKYTGQILIYFLLISIRKGCGRKDAMCFFRFHTLPFFT